MPQLMQLVLPQQEQLELELEPLVAAVSPSREASDTSITSISSMFLIASFIFLSSCLLIWMPERLRSRCCHSYRS